MKTNKPNGCLARFAAALPGLVFILALALTGCPSPTGGENTGGENTGGVPAWTEGVESFFAAFDSLETLSYRYLIDLELVGLGLARMDKLLTDGCVAITRVENHDPGEAALGQAAAKIRGWLDGSRRDYQEAVFGQGVLVRFPREAPSWWPASAHDFDSQQYIMQAAFERVYPREKGFWVLDVKEGSAYGWWVNSMGGEIFTPEERESGVLSRNITFPSKTFSAGSPLPRSQIVGGPQSGGATYYVNGFFANLGIGSWRAMDRDVFTWGPGGDGAMRIRLTASGPKYYPTALDWAAGVLRDEGITQAQVNAVISGNAANDAQALVLLQAAFPVLRPENRGWRPPWWFTEAPAVIAAYNACDALTPTSTGIKAREAKNLWLSMGTWNPTYAQYLFRTFDPYRAAYTKLYNLLPGDGVLQRPDFDGNDYAF